MATYRVRRRAGPTSRVTDLQRADLLGGLRGGRTFPSEEEAREAWQLLRVELIDECAPTALPWAYWQFESSPDDCTDEVIHAGEDPLAAHDRVSAARRDWARRVHAAMATTNEA